MMTLTMITGRPLFFGVPSAYLFVMQKLFSFFGYSRKWLLTQNIEYRQELPECPRMSKYVPASQD